MKQIVPMELNGRGMDEIEEPVPCEEAEAQMPMALVHQIL
jgi:hypothetical protein